MVRFAAGSLGLLFATVYGLMALTPVWSFQQTGVGISGIAGTAFWPVVLPITVALVAVVAVGGLAAMFRSLLRVTR